jgi:hypothetical protein
MKRLRALKTLHLPSATFAPHIEIIEHLPIQQGDTSIVVILKGETFNLPDDEAEQYIIHGWATEHEATQC